jgi:hypothetical protein
MRSPLTKSLTTTEPFSSLDTPTQSSSVWKAYVRNTFLFSLYASCYRWAGLHAIFKRLKNWWN